MMMICLEGEQVEHFLPVFSGQTQKGALREDKLRSLFVDAWGGQKEPPTAPTLSVQGSGLISSLDPMLCLSFILGHDAKSRNILSLSKPSRKYSEFARG